MRKPIMLGNNYRSIAALLGSGVKAWIYGSVATKSATDKSDLDIYVSGSCANAIERKNFITRPLVEYLGRTYPAHIIGPSVVSEEHFLKAQPEAIRVL